MSMRPESRSSVDRLRARLTTECGRCVTDAMFTDPMKWRDMMASITTAPVSALLEPVARFVAQPHKMMIDGE